MTYLLDTCVISELVKPRPDDQVLHWIDRVDERQLLLSVLTLGELEKGIARLPDSSRKSYLREWLENDLVERFAGRLLPVDDAVAIVWGRMQGDAEREGRRLPVIDSLLAATATVHHLTLVTRNLADFERCGIEVFNPWTA